MNNLFLPNESYTPYISLNQNSGIFEIKGESHMEYPHQFYQPILNWLNEFIRKKKSLVQFDFRMRYYNTGSSRVFFEIFELLDKIKVPVTINWYAERRDTDMIDEGDSFQEDFPNLDFNVIIQKDINSY